MDCHDLIGTWSISILKLILGNLILLRDEFDSYNESLMKTSIEYVVGYNDESDIIL